MTLNLFGKDFPAPSGDVEVTDKPSVLPEQLVKILHDLRFSPLESYSGVMEQLSQMYCERKFSIEELLPQNMPIDYVTEIETKIDTGIVKKINGIETNEYLRANSKKHPVCFVVKGSKLTSIVINSEYGLISQTIVLDNGNIWTYSLKDKRGETKGNKNIASTIEISLLFLPAITIGRTPLGHQEEYKFSRSLFTIKYGSSTFKESKTFDPTTNKYSGSLVVSVDNNHKNKWEIAFKDLEVFRLDQTGIMTIGEVCFHLFGNSAQYETTKKAPKYFFS